MRETKRVIKKSQDCYISRLCEGATIVGGKIAPTQSGVLPDEIKYANFRIDRNIRFCAAGGQACDIIIIIIINMRKLRFLCGGIEKYISISHNLCVCILKTQFAMPFEWFFN